MNYSKLRKYLTDSRTQMRFSQIPPIFNNTRQFTSTTCRNMNPGDCDRHVSSVNAHVPFKSHCAPGDLLSASQFSPDEVMFVSFNPTTPTRVFFYK